MLAEKMFRKSRNPFSRKSTTVVPLEGQEKRDMQEAMRQAGVDKIKMELKKGGKVVARVDVSPEEIKLEEKK